MKNKKTIMTILTVVLCVLFGWLGFYLFENQNIKPGVAGLAKRKVGIFYCSYNDDTATVVSMLDNILKTKSIEIKTNEPYPKDTKKFLDRITQENQNLTRVVLEDSNIDLQKYDYMIFATPVINNKPCPAIQRFVLDKYPTIQKKPVSVVILYKDGELPGNTMLFFTRKLALSVWKPPFVTKLKREKTMNYQLNMWLNNMRFKRKELRRSK